MALISLRPRPECWQRIQREYPVQEQKSDAFGRLIDKYVGWSGGAPMVLLDLGCGRGLESPRVYRRAGMLSIGLDLAEAVRENETVAYGVRADAAALPFGAETVDVVVCQQLIEHLERPGVVFCEVARVLRPGGIFLLMTPNLFGWPTLVSRLLPYGLHCRLNRELFGIDESDVFPTYYRANTVRGLDGLLRSAGLRPVEVQMVQPSPGILTFSTVLTRCEIAATRLLRRAEWLAPLRYVIMAAYAK
jgi:SAM-dependent methyltransferase